MKDKYATKPVYQKTILSVKGIFNNPGDIALSDVFSKVN